MENGFPTVGLVESNGDPAGLRRLAEHYGRKGDEMKRMLYLDRAAAAERKGRAAPRNPAAELLAEGRYRELAQRHAGDPAAFSEVSAALLRMGGLEQARSYLRDAPHGLEQRRKIATVDLLARIREQEGRTPRVHVIMLAHNRENFVAGALRGVAAADYPDMAVFVADNGSADATAREAEKALAAFSPGIGTHFTRLPTNIGRPAGHNWLLTAYDHSQAEYIAIVDDDLVEMPTDWLGRMTAFMDMFPDAAVAGVKALDPGPYGAIQGAGMDLVDFAPGRIALNKVENESDDGRHDYMGETDHVIGCLNLYRTEALFGGLGLFDIRFSPCQMVDLEHHLRARRKGWKVLYNGLVAVRHHREMGKKLFDDRFMFSNSMGNVVKLTNGVPAESMSAVIRESAARRGA